MKGFRDGTIGMYRNELKPELREIYDGASDEVSLQGEIKLMRTRLTVAIKDEDGRGIEAACAMLVRLIRAQAAIGGSGDLAQMLDEVGEHVLARQEKGDRP